MESRVLTTSTEGRTFSIGGKDSPVEGKNFHIEEIISSEAGIEAQILDIDYKSEDVYITFILLGKKDSIEYRLKNKVDY